MLGMAAFAAPAQAALMAVSPGTVPVDGTPIPLWYQDANGLQLTPCAPATANCGVGTGPFTPANPGGGEAFYNRAVAKLNAGPGGTAKITMTVAVEAAFAPRFPDLPITFGRIESKIVGGAPGATYTVTEPYGTQTIHADGAGLGITKDQIGCLIASAAASCDFTAAIPTTISTYLAWDAGAPAGFLGNGVTPHTITGSPLGHNSFIISGDGLAPDGGFATLTQPNWVVIGKLFNATTPAFGSSPANFGDQRLTTTSGPVNAVIRNDGGGAMTVNSVTLSGANAGDFALAGPTACVGATVPANGGMCPVPITFKPTATGTRTATLTVNDNALGSPHTIAITGNGTQSVIATTPGVSFGNQLVGTTTAPQTVAITNNGTASLNVSSVSVAGAAAGDYTMGINTCGPAVVPGASCHVDVFFTPSVAGIRNASMSVASDGGAASVPLNGVGVTPPANTPPAGAGAGTAGSPPGAGTTPPAGTTPAGTTPGGANTASSRPALALKLLGVQPRIKQIKAKKSGIRLVMNVPSGAEVLKVNVYRKTAKGLRLLASGYKIAPAAGVSHMSQNQPALRRLLTRGNYQVQVTPGYSKSELGKTSKASFTVV